MRASMSWSPRPIHRMRRAGASCRGNNPPCSRKVGGLSRGRSSICRFRWGRSNSCPMPWAKSDTGGKDSTTNRTLPEVTASSGVRASLPFWKVDPTVQSMLFNLNGLAHKVTLVSDLYWADASQNIEEFPLYDPLDDDSQEHFRGYLVPFPWSRDPRNYAFRAGMQGWVASPTAEMVDDVAAARLGIHQRWQTKRGLPGQQRVVDWIVLDIDGTIFPDKDRDNFSEYLGLLEYDFRWHVGDRVSILSDGYADFFPEGLKTISLGTAITRPQRGQLYGGIASHGRSLQQHAAGGRGQLSTESQVDLGYGGHLRSWSHRQHRRAAGDHACRRVDAGAHRRQCGFWPRQFRSGHRRGAAIHAQGTLGTDRGNADSATGHAWVSNSACAEPQDRSTGPIAFTRSPRTWRRKFGDALRGCGLAIRDHRSFWVHLAFAAGCAGGRYDRATCNPGNGAQSACASPACWSPRCSTRRSKNWLKAVDPDVNPHLRDALDIGSAAVLLAAAGAVRGGRNCLLVLSDARRSRGRPRS